MSSRRIKLVLKLAVSAAALGWALSRTGVASMFGAIARVPIGSLAAASALLSLNVVVGGLRWREIARSYRVPSPPLRFLVHGYLVAGFYNTFVPGNIGGDAIRAHAARSAFAHPADSYVSVIIERALGLSALVLLVGAGLVMGFPAWRWPGMGFLLLGVSSAALVGLGPSLLVAGSRWLPPRLRYLVPHLSRPRGVAAFATAGAWSVLSQALCVLATHALFTGLGVPVRAVDSLALVPLAMLSAYVPVSIGGLGVREAAFVILFGRLGVSAADATAASLAFMFVTVIVALPGGLAHAIWPLELPEQEEPGLTPTSPEPGSPAARSHR